MRYKVVDEGAFSEDDQAGRDALLALLFRLESSPDPAQVVILTDALLRSTPAASTTSWRRPRPLARAARPADAARATGKTRPGGSFLRYGRKSW
jgi:hypothetical protein